MQLTNTEGERAGLGKKINTEVCVGRRGMVATDEYSEDREYVGVGVTNKDSECGGV